MSAKKSHSNITIKASKVVEMATKQCEHIIELRKKDLAEEIIAVRAKLEAPFKKWSWSKFKTVTIENKYTDEQIVSILKGEDEDEDDRFSITRMFGSKYEQIMVTRYSDWYYNCKALARTAQTAMALNGSLTVMEVTVTDMEQLQPRS